MMLLLGHKTQTFMLHDAFLGYTHKNTLETLIKTHFIYSYQSARLTEQEIHDTNLIFMLHQMKM